MADHPVFGPTVSHPLVDDFTVRANRQRARQQPPGIPLVYPLPLRNHGLWSGNNELGIRVPFAADANRFQTILKMDEWGMPEVWTVMLGLSYRDEELTTSGFEIIAQVNAGSGGSTQEFQLDWIQGATFSAVMNAISVNALYINPERTPDGLELSVTLAPGDHGRHHATRSIREVDIAAGTTSDNVRIPAFARRVMALPLSGATSDSMYAPAVANRLVIDEDPGGIGTPALSIGGSVLPSFAPFGVPIPTKGKYVHWVNASAIEHDIVYLFLLDL